MKTRNLIIIFIILLVLYFVFFRTGNPFAAADKSAAPGLIHSTRF